MAAAHDTHGLFARRAEYGWQTDARELTEFFCCYEADVGFRTTHSAMIAAWAGVQLGLGSRADFDPYADIVPKITEGKRVYRTLQRMDARGQRAEVVTLFRLYGPRNGHAEHHEFGDLAPLASYTDAAEAARVELALRESTRRAGTVAEVVSRSLDRERPAIEAEFWRVAGQIESLERRIAWHDRAVMRPASDDKARERQEKSRRALRALYPKLTGYREFQRRLLDAYSYDGVLRARLGVMTSVDREITVGDALRWKLISPARRPGDRDSYAAWTAAKAVFVAQVREEAKELRRRAHAAYRAAKGAS